MSRRFRRWAVRRAAVDPSRMTDRFSMASSRSNGANRAVRFDHRRRNEHAHRPCFPERPAATWPLARRRRQTGRLWSAPVSRTPSSNSTGGHAYRYVHGAPVPVSADSGTERRHVEQVAGALLERQPGAGGWKQHVPAERRDVHLQRRVEYDHSAGLAQHGLGSRRISEA